MLRKSAPKTTPNSDKRVRFSKTEDSTPRPTSSRRSQARRGRGRGSYVVVTGRNATQALTRDDYYEGGKLKPKFVLRK